MKTNRICKICGEAYYYCVACDQARAGAKGYEPWHILVHDENCHKIFDTLQRHFTKEYSNEQAREILKTCDLSVIDSASEIIKKQIAGIMKEKNVQMVEEPIKTDKSTIPHKPKSKKVIEES